MKDVQVAANRIESVAGPTRSAERDDEFFLHEPFEELDVREILVPAHGELVRQDVERIGQWNAHVVPG